MGFQYELLPYLAQKFRHSRQKCILRVQKNIRWKIGFRLENVTVFHEHLEFTQKNVGLLVKKFSTFVITAFYLHEGSFWRKWFSRKNFVFQIFLKVRGEIIFDQEQPCLFTVDRTASSNSGAPFWDFFQQFRIFSSISGTKNDFSSIFSSKISAQSSKMHFTCTDEHLMKNWISAERCNLFFITFGFYEKKCRILLEEFDKFVRAAFGAYGRSFWRKTTPRKNLVFHIILGLGGGIFLIRHNLVCSLLTRLGFDFWSSILRFFPTISNFFVNFGISVWTFPYLAQNFRGSRQKCVLRVQTNIWWKICLRLGSVTNFNNIRTLHKKLSDF